MEKLCSQCPEECWFMSTTEKLIEDHNKNARNLGTENAVWLSDLLKDDIELINDTEKQIENMREEILDECPNYTHIPDYIGRWIIY
jgi:hypothetical protein